MVTREQFVINLKNQLDELNNDIKKIELKAESVRENAKEKIQLRIKKLQHKRDAALTKIQEIKNSSDDAWQDLKQGTENVLESLKAGVVQTLANFKRSKSSVSAEKFTDE